jgi:hypothetical protein
VGARERVILAAGDVVDLQFFLMDAAKRYVASSGSDAATDDLLSHAAALDYALLMSSEHDDEPIDDASALGTALRSTMTKATLAALDVARRMLSAREETFEDFVERHILTGNVFATIRALRERGATEGDEIPFRALTIASDLLERRR